MGIEAREFPESNGDAEEARSPSEADPAKPAVDGSRVVRKRLYPSHNRTLPRSKRVS
jgi:hypothetical protein